MYQTLVGDIKQENAKLKNSDKNDSTLTSTDWLLSEARLLLRLSEVT